MAFVAPAVNAMSEDASFRAAALARILCFMSSASIAAAAASSATPLVEVSRWFVSDSRRRLGIQPPIMRTNVVLPSSCLARRTRSPGSKLFLLLGTPSSSSLRIISSTGPGATALACVVNTAWAVLVGVFVSSPPAPTLRHA